MKNGKILAALVTLGLATAAAVPAMAFTNEFHGMYQLNFDNSNFNGTDYANSEYLPSGKAKKATSATFFEQRARLQYTGKVNEDLKLVTHFEINSIWGDNDHSVATTGGGAIGADTVNLRTKNVYIDKNTCKSNVNLKLGIQGFTDAYKGIILDDDVAGILASTSYFKNSTVSVGFFRLNDKNTTGTAPAPENNSLGKYTRDFWLLDGKYNISKETKVGGSYYAYRDSRDTSDILAHTFGVNSETVVGPVNLSGFLLYQTGKAHNATNPDMKIKNAFAANVGAKIAAGPGTARTSFVYASGDKNPGSNNGAFETVYGNADFYEHEMVILGRDKNALGYDSAIVFDMNNKNQGAIFAAVGYDLPINKTVTASMNAGFAGVAKRNTASTGSGNYLGTEINAETVYKIDDTNSVSLRAGYVILGGLYNNVSASGGRAANPYDLKVVYSFVF